MFFFDNCFNSFKIREKISFVLGMTSTMPIVGINVGSTDISLFKLFFFSFLLYTGLETCKNGFIIKRASKFFQLWLLICILSGSCGWIFLTSSYPEWSSAAFSSVFRIVPFLLFSLFWSSLNDGDEMNNAVVKGFLFGCIANCIWTMIDAGGFYLMGKSINNICFSGYISRHGIRYDSLSLVYSASGIIRSSGFNSDPAHIGFIAPILVGVAVMTRKFWLLFIALGAMLASASTTSFVCSIIIFILCLRRGMSNLFFSEYIILRCFLFLTFSIVFFIFFKNEIIIFATNSFVNFFQRVGMLYFQNFEMTENIRLAYLLYAPFAFIEMAPFALLGSGLGTSSLGYTKLPFFSSHWGDKVYFAYDMENTYIAYLLDLGIIGFCIYLFILLFIYKSFRVKNNFNYVDVILYSTFLSIVFSAAFYHYILFAPQMLMFIITLSILDKECKI